MTSATSREADHVKIVDTVGQVAVFPACRAVVHHGGSGTTAAALRAGIPTLILFAFWLDQPIWAVAVEQLKKSALGGAFRLPPQESPWPRTCVPYQLHTTPPRAREVAASDDQTRRKPGQRSRSHGRRRLPGTLCLSSDEICGGGLVEVLLAMSSPAPPLPLWSCCAEATTCAWRCHRTCFASSSRRGLLRFPTAGNGRRTCATRISSA